MIFRQMAIITEKEEEDLRSEINMETGCYSCAEEGITE